MMIPIRTTAIPSEIDQKWQTIVNILADILAVPSAIITRLETPLIEVVKSADLADNPYKAGDKVEMARHYCEAVITENCRLEINYAPQDPS